MMDGVESPAGWDAESAIIPARYSASQRSNKCSSYFGKNSDEENMLRLAAIQRQFSVIIGNIGAFFLIPLMLLTVVDVLLRYFLNAPIRGTSEWSEFLLVVVIWLGFAYTMQTKGHISIELFVSRISERKQTYADIFAYFIGLFIMAIVAWMSYKLAVNSWVLGEIGENSRFPLYPFKGILFIGSAIFFIELLAQLLIHLLKLRRKMLKEV